LYFAQEEGPQLVATARALWPRWSTFILTGLLAGLRWGESAALYRTDIDWKRGQLHVQRTWSEKGNRIEACKDGEDRWVKASPALLEALKEHLAAVELEGQVKDWTAEPRQLVFPNTLGRITHYGQFLETVWQQLLGKAGLPYLEVPRHPPQLRHVAPLGWCGPPVGAAADGARVDRPDSGHLRARPARAPRVRGGRPRPLPEGLTESQYSEGPGRDHVPCTRPFVRSRGLTSSETPPGATTSPDRVVTR
jgi:integrase